MLRPRFGFAGLALTVGLALPLFTKAEAPRWQAGAATIDITPKDPVWLAGYAARKSPSEGVELPIHAKALALRDESGKSVLLITLDLIGVKRPLTARVKDRIQKELGIPPAAVVLLASHTHCAPIPMDTPERLNAYNIDPQAAQANVAWTRDLEHRLVQVAAEAVAQLRPAELSYGHGRARFAMNRREKTATGYKIGVNPDGPTDPTVPVLRVVDRDSVLRAVVFGYACHNTTLGGDMLRINGDYAGFAQEALEQAHPGAVALFVTGCAADANPHPRGTIEQARSHGQALAEAVEDVLGHDTIGLSGGLRFALVEPILHFGGPTDRASYEQRLNEPNANRQAHARRMIDRLEKGEPIEADHPYTIQALALGDQLTLLALAGEVVVDYALRLREELGGSGRALWVAGYANDVFGYVPSLRVLKEGGYEGGEAFYYSAYPTPFAEDVESIIVQGARQAVEQVRAR